MRLIHAWRRAWRWSRQHSRRPFIQHAVEKLHIGCGPQARSGWTNVDIELNPGVDFVLDVRRGLPFRDATYIYAEHFLEHLSYDEGIAFLRECRRVLRADGVLRLSTPNLEWVWLTQYRQNGTVADCFAINKAFRGWGHQFLYNYDALTTTLRAVGFADIQQCRYGESADPALQNLEQHAADTDTTSLPHVVIVEARGVADRDRAALDDLLDDYDWAMHP